jgi:hypothetical protein
MPFFPWVPVKYSGIVQRALCYKIIDFTANNPLGSIKKSWCSAGRMIKVGAYFAPFLPPPGRWFL